MGKKNSIKKFRESWEDDEWGQEDRSTKNKEKKRSRKESRKQKFSNRWYDEDMKIKRKKRN